MPDTPGYSGARMKSSLPLRSLESGGEEGCYSSNHLNIVLQTLGSPVEQGSVCHVIVQERDGSGWVDRESATTEYLSSWVACHLLGTETTEVHL